MPTTYSAKDNLPMQEGGDANDIAVFIALRDTIDGKLVLTCTSGTRPTGTARFTGRLIYETDTKMWRTWNGSRWAWTGGTPEMRALTLPLVTGTVGGFVTFPTTAGGSVAAQTNDPDSALVVVTTAGSQGIQVRDAGIYEACVTVGASTSSANAIVYVSLPGGLEARTTFGPSGDAMAATPFFIAAANEIVVPKIYVYSDVGQTFSGTLYVRKVGEK